MKSKKILSILSVSLISLSMLGSIVNTNTKPIDEIENRPSIEKMKELKKECFVKSIEELKNSGVLTQQDVDNINNYMAKLRKEKETEKDRKNQYRGNKENIAKENRYNNNNHKKRSLIDDMVKDKVITKDQGDKLEETIRKNREKMKSNINNQ